jgi:hypothetical protein
MQSETRRKVGETASGRGAKTKMRSMKIAVAVMVVIAVASLLVEAQTQNVIVRDPWRALDGKTNQVARTGGVAFEGRIVSVSDDELRIKGAVGGKDMEFVVLHFPHKVKADEIIGLGNDLYAWPIATPTDAGKSGASPDVPKFEYGKPCLPRPADISNAAEFSEAKHEAAIKKAEGYKAAFEVNRQHALAGDADSQLKLGQLYLAGHGCQMDTNQARIWLQKAADQGNQDAAKELAVLAMTIANSGNRP